MRGHRRVGWHAPDVPVRHFGGGSAPKPPSPPPPPPTRDDAAIKQAAADERKRLRIRRGRQSTLLSEPMAAATAGETQPAKTTLLGGP